MLITGIVHVTGEHDTGKTSFSLECGAQPEDICFIDSDEKGQTTVKQIREAYREEKRDFGFYEDFIARTAGMTQLQVYDYGSQLIDDIETDRYGVIIWDGWSEKYSSSMKPYVRQNPNEFRHPKDWAAQGSIKGPQQWRESFGLEAVKLAQLQEKAPLVIILTHLKNYYARNQKVEGVMVPRASATLRRIPRFRVWLRHNPVSSIPIGLVLKRLDVKRITDRGLRTTCVLPRKLTPNVRLPEEDVEPSDESLWDTIARYMEHPFGNRKPLPEEVPNEFELSILDGTLTAEQKINLRLALQSAAAEEPLLTGEVKSKPAPDKSLVEYVAKMRKDGAEDAYIAKSLRGTESKGYKAIADALGVKVRDVRKWCRD